jgi:DNA end-binding protein Ku
MKRTSSTKKRRPLWKGYLKIGLVSFPVRAFSARAKEESEIDLDWLHRDCHRRIQYRKVCPVHGEVGQDEIVSGYQVSRGKYVIIEPEELARLRGVKGDKVLSVEAMVEPETIDCMYYTDKSYYLLPDGPVADKPYAVIAHAMNEQRRHGVAQVVLFRREQLVLVRVVKGLLMMTVLNHENEFQSAAAFARDVPRSRPAARELSMAKTLLDAMSDRDFDFADYKDEYIEHLQELIRRKSRGQPIEAPVEEEEPPVANFMDALRQSLAQVRSLPAHRGNGHPRRARRQRRRAS